MKLSNDVITLVRNSLLSENDDLKLSQAECFDIVLNNTKEVVGIISYRYKGYNNYIDYGGNINYHIKSDKRGNGYSKSALTLMLDILKENTKFDEPLYVASSLDNKNYLKVAYECGGKMIHRGKVPDTVIDQFYDHDMQEVEVYRFDIEKLKFKER